MLKASIRWFLPMIALLLLATVLLFTSVINNSHAAGQPNHIIAVPTSTPVVTPTGGSATPDYFWGGN